MTKNFRIEKDSMGTIEGPMGALWGAQTQNTIFFNPKVFGHYSSENAGLTWIRFSETLDT